MEPERPRVGLLGLTLEFYETLAPELRPDREAWVRGSLIPALAPFAEAVFPGAAWTAGQVERQLAEFEARGLDAVVVVLLAYAPSLIAAPALARTRLPVIVWNTQELWAVDGGYDDAALLRNHGVHGTQDLCNVLVRQQAVFHYVTGHVRDAAAMEELADALHAARAVRHLRRARLGLMGYPFPGMGDFGLDTTHLATSLGCRWEPLSVADFNRRADAAPAGEVRGLIEQYRRDYEVASEVTAGDLEACARAEFALRAMVAEHRLDAYSYQFLAFGDDDRTETVPFVAAGRLLAEGVGFGGEGDLISAAWSAFLARLQPPASFSEIFTIDFAGDGVLLSHMGECNPAMGRRDRRVRLVRRPAPIVPVRSGQCALVFSYEPGPATWTCLTLGPRTRWRVIAAPVRIEDFGPLGQLAVPHSKMRPAGGVRGFLTRYAEAGGPHHAAICFGDARRRLAVAARFLDADYVEV